jgi:adenine C2-methylase RlmN of 23S rRNA A2503 and tRNA A37
MSEIKIRLAAPFIYQEDKRAFLIVKLLKDHNCEVEIIPNNHIIYFC